MYLPAEDRLQFSMRGKADWLLTRSLLLKLVQAWLIKLETIDLPEVAIPLGKRNIGQEHSLSLEFDAPQTMEHQPSILHEAILIHEISLTVEATGTLVVLKGQGLQTRFSLTRKESHLVLELLAKKARSVNWIEAVGWPQWLGTQATPPDHAGAR